MTVTRGTKWLLAGFFVLVSAIIYIPLLIILVNSFNTSLTFAWPPPGFTLEWWSRAVSNEGVRDAFVTSVVVATVATLVALVLGTLVSFDEVLRTQHDLLAGGTTDRAARHRDRSGPQHHVHVIPGRTHILHVGRRARDVLHRGGVQQHLGEVATTRR